MKTNDQNRKFVHVAIMGDSKVGKTSISQSYCQNSMKEIHEGTVFDNYVIPINIMEESAINMFDVSAKKNFEAVRSFAYQESEVLLLCFSTCDRETFASITDLWMPELKRHTKHSKQKRPVILVGTQIDLRVGNDAAEVTTDEGAQKAKEIGADCYVECSARDRKCLEDVFQKAVSSALKFRRKKTNVFKQIFRRKSGSFSIAR